MVQLVLELLREVDVAVVVDPELRLGGLALVQELEVRELDWLLGLKLLILSLAPDLLAILLAILLHLRGEELALLIQTEHLVLVFADLNIVKVEFLQRRSFRLQRIRSGA